jgi:PhnB protein
MTIPFAPAPQIDPTATFFAPHLSLKNVLDGINFYVAAFGAVEVRRFSNDDGSVHVAELRILGALFHLHEEVTRTREMSPQTLGGTTCAIGLFTPDPDALMRSALAAGGREVSAMRDYFYGYRQGTVADPFGHHWLLQRRCPEGPPD